MAKQGWAAKLKEELADAKAKLKIAQEEIHVLKNDLTNKDGVVSKKTSIIIGIIAFIAGALIF